MGFRFRKSVTLFPGVRVNLSGSGISTTIGGRGASVNIGRKGAYLNVGVPGSGLSFRTRLDGGSPPPRPSGYVPPPPPSPGPTPSPTSAPPRHLLPGEGEIRSAAVSALTSEGLSELKRIINQAVFSQKEAKFEAEQAERRLAVANSRLAKAQKFILRLALWFSIPARQQEVAQHEAELAKCKAELDACHINLDFAFDQGTLAAYEALRMAHGRLRSCAAIWDVTSSYLTNQPTERTMAWKSIERKPVRLSETTSSIIDTKWSALRFENANGDDLLFYPGFVLMGSDNGNFALIDLRDVSIDFDATNFHEEERVPRDTEVVGETWKKANKDGSPDRRFANNYRIPVVRYGRLVIKSKTGVNEEYMLSNPQVAQDFAQAFSDLKLALQRLNTATKVDGADPSVPALPEPDEDVGDDTHWEDGVSGDDAQSPKGAGRPPAYHLLADIAVLAVVAVIAALVVRGVRFPDVATTPPSAEQIRVTGPMPDVGSVVVVKPDTAHGRPHANVRSQPNLNSSTVGWPTSGTRLVVFETSGAWLKISEAMGKEALGWINAADVQATAEKASFQPESPPPAQQTKPTAAKAPEQPARETIVVKAQAANIRAQASGSSAVVSRATAGAMYSVFEKDADWLRIGDKEPIGWMHKSLVGSPP